MPSVGIDQNRPLAGPSTSRPQTAIPLLKLSAFDPSNLKDRGAIHGLAYLKLRKFAPQRH
jgi:hypothetical protein